MEHHALNARLQALLPLPGRIARLPVSDKGYPVPWFAAWLTPDGKAAPRKSADAKPDLRVVLPGMTVLAHNKRLCWVCGEPMGLYKAFTIGPMCAVNRISAEPPSHRECAIFSARACPFLTQPKMKRNEADLPDGVVPDGSNAPGVMLRRNPGVTLVWVTRSYQVQRERNGPLFRIGPWTEVMWFARGERATRQQVMESINTGLPSLRQLARLEGQAAQAALERQLTDALQLVPA